MIKETALKKTNAFYEGYQGSYCHQENQGSDNFGIRFTCSIRVLADRNLPAMPSIYDVHRFHFLFLRVVLVAANELSWQVN
jgi:hypothetical protein